MPVTLEPFCGPVQRRDGREDHLPEQILILIDIGYVSFLCSLKMGLHEETRVEEDTLHVVDGSEMQRLLSMFCIHTCHASP